MSSIMLFQFIGDTVDKALNIYINTASGSIVSSIVNLAILLTTFYYVMLGFMIALGKVEAPFSTLMISCGKFILISTFALNANMYLTWVVEAIHGLEAGLTASFSGINGIAPTSVYGIVDSAFSQGMDLSAQLWEKAGQRDWDEFSMALGDFFNSIIIAIATFAISMPAGAMILVAKAVLSIMLGIGPFFIMCLMYPLTKGFFDRWFSVVMSSVFQISLLAAVLSFAIKIFLAFVIKTDLNSIEHPLFASSQLLVVALIMMSVLYTVNNYAAQLAGGMSTAAITLGGMAAKASGLASGGGNAVRSLNNIANPTSTRRDIQSGMMVSGRRADHLAAGNSVFNPAYRQHVMQNLGKNWGWARGGKIKE